MIKEALAGIGLAPFSVGGLLLFFAVFVGVTIWALTRSRGEIATWSSLPLADGLQPVQPRLPIAPLASHEQDECGECEDCSCKTNEP
jgi:cbb3-type cytochrome oxidase subunit 3